MAQSYLYLQQIYHRKLFDTTYAIIFYMNLESREPIVSLPKNSNEKGYDLERMAREELPVIQHDFLHIDGQDKEALKQWFRYLQTILNNPENYMDHGGAAVVFSINETICIKMILDKHNSENAHLFNLGNTAEKEMRIQERLEKLSVAGVRCPKTILFLEGDKYHGIVMEKLDAVNLQKCLNGEQIFTSSFEGQEFLYDLEEYVYAMHDDYDVGHDDLYSRNVMIDNKTGKPIIIDFGRSKIKNENAKQEDKKRLQEITTAIHKNLTK